MEPENQHIEWKESWKDDFLKHICAFANTQGGSLYVGIRDDGTITGVKNSKKLLEDIPNKTINFLGIIVDVITHNKSGMEYIEIIVHQSSVPISYRGIYYVKSGSTKQELKGAALQQFILKKMGKTFDELPVDSADISCIDQNVVKKFLKKAQSVNRISQNTEPDNISSILLNLKLITEDNKVKNAAILLFGKDPLKFFISATFKIGRFGDSDHDLRFQDVIEGNIFEMPEKVIEILRAKYLISPIRYDGLQRIEELEYPEDSLREAILNAIVHKDYTGAPIQLSIYDNKLILWNEGKLPSGLTVQLLKEKHPSRPHNRNIADIFFKAGYIETWGRGIEKIMEGCKTHGLPQPLFEELAGGVQVTFFKNKKTEVVTTPVTTPATTPATTPEEKVLNCILKNNNISKQEIGNLLGITRDGVSYHIKKLRKKGIIVWIGSPTKGYWEIVKQYKKK